MMERDHLCASVCICVGVYVNEYRSGHRLEGKLFPRELSEGVITAFSLAAEKTLSSFGCLLICGLINLYQSISSAA